MKQIKKKKKILNSQHHYSLQSLNQKTGYHSWLFTYPHNSMFYKVSKAYQFLFSKTILPLKVQLYGSARALFIFPVI